MKIDTNCLYAWKILILHRTKDPNSCKKKMQKNNVSFDSFNILVINLFNQQPQELYEQGIRVHGLMKQWDRCLVCDGN